MLLTSSKSTYVYITQTQVHVDAAFLTIRSKLPMALTSDCQIQLHTQINYGIAEKFCKYSLWPLNEILVGLFWCMPTDLHKNLYPRAALWHVKKWTGWTSNWQIFGTLDEGKIRKISLYKIWQLHSSSDCATLFAI